MKRYEKKLKKANIALYTLATELGVTTDHILKSIVSCTPGMFSYLMAGDPAKKIIDIESCELAPWLGNVYIETRCIGEDGPIDYARFLPNTRVGR